MALEGGEWSAARLGRTLPKAGWAPGPVWTGGKSRPHRDSIPDRPARSQSLYRLSQIAGSLEIINIKRCRVELGFGPVRVMLFIGYTYLGSMINDARCTRIKLNPGLPWKKQHSARIRLLSPANWTLM